jgi:hypothetical protein
VWGALLLQRGLLPLHGSALRLGDGAVILAGSTGNGKSTLAAALMEQGFTLIADELCALSIQKNSGPVLLPGFPQILLWADTLKIFNKDISHLTSVRPGIEKYIIPVESHNMQSHLPLERIYILVPNNSFEFNIIDFHGMKKIHALIDCTYRVHNVAGLGLRGPHFQQCADVAKRIIVKKLERPATPFDIENLVKRFMEDF